MLPVTLEQLAALDQFLTDEEKLVRENVRRFVRERYLPRAAELFEKEQFPRDLIPELAELGLLGASIDGYGCAGMNPVAYGLLLEELEYGDSGLRSFVSVQGSLAMNAIHFFGTEEQKERYLPEMARGNIIGCFGLTEPDSGSDPGSMQTRARADGDAYVISGTKRWITNAPFADVAVVWAKIDAGGAESVRGDAAHGGQNEPARERDRGAPARGLSRAEGRDARAQAGAGRAAPLPRGSALRHFLGRRRCSEGVLRLRA
jgi:glutaryl-CoA dehydrogenase